MIKDIDCLILCGGKGNRLKKITGKLPKPMLTIGSRPFLDILIGYLRHLGFKRFILAIGYKADFIRKYYSEHELPGVEFVFSREKRPLGTGGAVKQAEKFIRSKELLVINGDSFSDFNPKRLLKFFKRRRARAVILLRRMKDNKDYGLVFTGVNNQIVSFNEKSQSKSAGFINSGIYLFNRKIFSMMPEKPVFSLEYDFFPGLVGKGLYGFPGKSFFIDIGTPQRYLIAKKYFLKRKESYR